MLSVIIPTRDKASRLRVCLRALAEATRKDSVMCEIITVDDGSQDETAETVETARRYFRPPLRLIRRSLPGGRSVARNAGAAAALGARLLFLDDDILVGADTLARHAQLTDMPRPRLGRATILNLPWLRSVPDPTLLGPELAPGLARRMLPPADDAGLLAHAARLARRSSFEADLHRLLSAHREDCGGRWPAATGGNLSVSRAFFSKIDGFDPKLGLRWGVEDLEFGFRAEMAGAGLVHLADVPVYHMDHPVAMREVDHQIALEYFGQKHGVELGARLAEYFAGRLPLVAVVRQ